MAYKNLYSNVDEMVYRVDHQLISRASLASQRCRFRKEGRGEEVKAITEALTATSKKESSVLRQASRLAAKASLMSPESAGELKESLAPFAGVNSPLQVSVFLAWQTWLESTTGQTFTYDEVMAYILLNSAQAFADITGELPVLV